MAEQKLTSAANAMAPWLGSDFARLVRDNGDLLEVARDAVDAMLEDDSNWKACDCGTGRICTVNYGAALAVAINCAVSVRISLETERCAKIIEESAASCERAARECLTSGKQDVAANYRATAGVLTTLAHDIRRAQPVKRSVRLVEDTDGR